MLKILILTLLSLSSLNGVPFKQATTPCAVTKPATTPCASKFINFLYFFEIYLYTSYF
jgi:hypothetical protein